MSLSGPFRFSRLILAAALIVQIATTAFAQTRQASPKLPNQSYKLSFEEISVIKQRSPSTAQDFVWERKPGQIGASIDRLAARLMGSGKERLSGNDWSLSQTFWAFMGGPPDDVEIRDNRFMFVSGCRHRSCGEKAAFVLDLEAGDIAFGLIHAFDASGKRSEENSGKYLGPFPFLTIFHAECAKTGFSDVARTILSDRWIQRIGDTYYSPPPQRAIVRVTSC